VRRCIRRRRRRREHTGRESGGDNEPNQTLFEVHGGTLPFADHSGDATGWLNPGSRSRTVQPKASLRNVQCTFLQLCAIRRFLQGRPLDETQQAPPTSRWAELALPAGHLSQRWNQDVWGRVTDLLADPPAFASETSGSQPRPRQRQVRLSPERWHQVVDQYVAGTSARELARQHGVDPQTVLTQLRKRGIAVRPNPPGALTGDDLIEALKLRETGWTYMQIGQQFDVTGNAVAKAFARYRSQQAS
jgi:transposase-like protein